MSNVQTVRGRVHMAPAGQSIPPLRVGYEKAYGTGGYLEYQITDGESCVSACRTTDDTMHWYLADSDEGVAVVVVKGDVAKIRELVKSEIDHFDSELIWVDVN